MAAVTFTKASKKRARLRLSIEGLTGSGKTYSGILLSKCIIGEPFKLPDDKQSRIFVIDSERSSAELYADEFDFLHCNLNGASPKAYVDAIRAAEEAGAEAIIVDSITPEWKWCLTEVDRIKPKYGNNKWSAWSEVRPQHDDFMEAILGCRAHIIATTRAKPATAQDQENGKTKIVQIGLEGIQDDMVPYFFGIVMKMDADHNGVITKTRCRALDGGVYPFPGEVVANIIKAWLDSGVPDIEMPNTLEDAIKLGVTAAMTGATADDRKRAYEAAKATLLGWCKARGRSDEEATQAVSDLKQRTMDALARTRPGATVPVASASAAPSQPTTTPASPVTTTPLNWRAVTSAGDFAPDKGPVGIIGVAIGAMAVGDLATYRASLEAHHDNPVMAKHHEVIRGRLRAIYDVQHARGEVTPLDGSPASSPAVAPQDTGGGSADDDGR